MAADTKPTHRIVDLSLWILVVLAVASLIGFGAYYYYDRYAHPSETVLERQASHIEELVRQDPQNPNLRVNIATYYLEAGRADLAIQQAQEALKLDEKNEGALIVLGTCFRQQGDIPTALEYFNRVVELSKDNPAALVDPQIERVYYELGGIYTEQGKLPQAVEALKSALAIDHTDADAHYALGKVYQEQSDHVNAIQEFEQALRFDPTYDQPYRRLVTSYSALGKKPEAAYAQGMIAFTEGKYDDAATQLEAVIRQAPDLTRAFLGLGLTYEKLGRFEEAQSALQKYLQAYPDEFAGVDAFGRVSKEVKK